MKLIGTHNYFVYIVTNYNKTVLYTGVTNNLKKRIYEHEQESKKIGKKHFTGKYKTFYLVYYERFDFIEHAIGREKEIKGWTRKKKEMIITNFNKEWRFLNDEIE